MLQPKGGFKTQSVRIAIKLPKWKLIRKFSEKEIEEMKKILPY